MDKTEIFKYNCESTLDNMFDVLLDNIHMSG